MPIIARGRDLTHRTHRHETHDDVRLAEIAKAPGHRREPTHCGQAIGQVEKSGLHLCQRFAAAASGAEHHHERHEHQRDKHDQALHEVGQADRQEPADHRIGQHDPGGEPDAGRIIAHARHVEQTGKGRLEQLATTYQTGGGIDGEEQHDDHRRNHPQRDRLVGKTVGEEFGNGQGVAVIDRLLPQARCDDDPVDQRANEQSDADPRLDQPGSIERPWQAEQQPARHVRSPGRERGHRRMEVAAPEQVAFAVGSRLAPGVGADGQHEDEIECE